MAPDTAGQAVFLPPAHGPCRAQHAVGLDQSMGTWRGGGGRDSNAVPIRKSKFAILTRCFVDSAWRRHHACTVTLRRVALSDFRLELMSLITAFIT